MSKMTVVIVNSTAEIERQRDQITKKVVSIYIKHICQFYVFLLSYI